MTSLFDGMAGALADVFGAPVVLRDPLRVERTVTAIFRNEFIDVLDGDGGAVGMARPMLRLPQTVVGTLGPGHEVAPGDGKWYRVLRPRPKESPASDGLVTFDLEQVR